MPRLRRGVRWAGCLVSLGLLAACATSGSGMPGPGRASGAAFDEKTLARERAALQQTAQARPPAQLTPALHRDLGWTQLLGGDDQAAQTELTLARRGAADVRTLFGLGLLAQESGRTRVAQGLWLELLERVAGGKACERPPTAKARGGRPEPAADEPCAADLAAVRQQRGAAPAEAPAGDPYAAPLAEVAAHRLLTLGGDGGGAEAEAKLRQRLQSLWRHADGLPLEARQLLAALLGQRLRLFGDEEGALKLDTERGCPQWFYVAGPLGHLPVLDLQTALSPDDPARDPQRGGYLRRSGSGCSLILEGIPGRPGVMYATTFLRTDRAGEWPVTVESGTAPWALYVDGRQAYLDAEPIRRRRLWLQLPAGWHSLAIKIGVGGGHAQVQLAVPGVHFFSGPAAQAPQPLGAGAISARPRPLSELPPAQAAWESALLRLVTAQQAYLSGDTEAGLAAMAPLAASAPRFGAASMVHAGLVLDDRGRPERLGRDQARAILEQALIHHPELLRARLSLATMLLQDDKAEQALERLDAAPAAEPSWQQALLRYRVLKARSFTHEAEQALTEARTLGPSACPILEQLTDWRREQQDVRGALQAAKELAACNPYSDRYAEELLDAEKLPESLREYNRLLTLEPDNADWLHGLAKVLTQRRGPGDRAHAESLLQGLCARAPTATANYLELANLRVDDGDRTGAEQTLRRGLREVPESAELQRALLALGARDELDAFRLDGKQVIAAFQERKDAFGEEPAVLVLDRTVVRVLPTGARLTLTHNIIRVLTKDGLGKFGEVNIPEGADVLTLRTVKADGTTREPEEIPDKDTVSAPDLEVGDYVEFEYVDREEPQPAFPGGFLAERFYFASADAPLDRSEYLLIVPKAMALQIDARGPERAGGGREVPEPQIHDEGGERHYFYVQKRVPRMIPEAPMDAALLDDWMPSIRVGSGLSFPRYVNYLRERRYRSLRLTRELRALAAEIAGPRPGGADDSEPAASILARTGKLDAWVRKNIRTGGSIDEQASSILARREGRRDVLLLALLRAAGIPCEAWLVRSQSAAHLEGPLPDILAYNEVLVAVAPGRGAGGGPLLWLDPIYRHLPTGYVRPMLRGGKAIRLPEIGLQPPVQSVAFTTVALPPEGGAPVAAASATDASGALPPELTKALRDKRQLALKMSLQPDGSGEVTVRETLTGWPALEWREQVENIAEEKLRQQIEQRALGFYFPGASLLDLKYGPMEKDGAELIVEYRFRAPRLGRSRRGAAGAELVLPAPYPLLLGRNYVSVAHRRTPMMLHYALPTVLEAQIILPPGARVTQLAAPVQLSDFGTFSQKVTAADDRILLRTETALPLTRLLPDRYPRFVEFATRIDAAEEAIAVLALP